MVKHAARALHPGGILLAYTPQITQAVQLRETLAESDFGMAETIEVLQRELAHRGPVGAARPSDGGPHRLPHPRPAAGQPLLNTLDLLLVVCGVAAAIGGYRLGFLDPGVVVGGLGGRRGGGRPGAPADPAPAGRGEQRRSCSSSRWGSCVGSAFIGQALGLHRGRSAPLPRCPVRACDPSTGRPVRRAGVVGVLVAIWILLPLMADVPGWFAAQARGSTLAAWVDDRFPDPPDTVDTLRRLVGEEQFARVFDDIEPSPRSRPAPVRHEHPPAGGRRRDPLDGEGGGRRVLDASRRGAGSWWAPGLVVTNAHVVAGEDETIVERSDGSEVRAEVVAFDPDRDLAVLRARRPRATRLSCAGTIDEGGVGAVFGHPGGGALRAAPFEVGEQVTADRHRHLRPGADPSARC